MVLGNSIKAVLIIVSIILTVGWSLSRTVHDIYHEDDSAELLGLSLRLISTNDGAILEYSKKGEENKSVSPIKSKIHLKLKPPCRFLRMPDGKIRYHYYKQFDDITVLIAIGDLVRIKSASTNHEDEYLGRELQGIIIKDNQADVYNELLESMGVKIKSGVDEKTYYHIADEYCREKNMQKLKNK